MCFPNPRFSQALYHPFSGWAYWIGAWQPFIICAWDNWVFESDGDVINAGGWKELLTWRMGCQDGYVVKITMVIVVVP